jgi:hypothetical protein
MREPPLRVMMGAFVPPGRPSGRLLQRAVMASMVDVVTQFARTEAEVVG